MINKKNNNLKLITFATALLHLSAYGMKPSKPEEKIAQEEKGAQESAQTSQNLVKESTELLDQFILKSPEERAAAIGEQIAAKKKNFKIS